MTRLEKLTWAVLFLALFLSATLASGVFFHIRSRPAVEVFEVPLERSR